MIMEKSKNKTQKMAEIKVSEYLKLLYDPSGSSNFCLIFYLFFLSLSAIYFTFIFHYYSLSNYTSYSLEMLTIRYLLSWRFSKLKSG